MTDFNCRCGISEVFDPRIECMCEAIVWTGAQTVHDGRPIPACWDLEPFKDLPIVL